MPAQLYVISGPSGVGKSTLIRRVRENVQNIGYTISHTSRKPRSNEQNGKAYHFVDHQTFQKMINEKAFVEWAEVYDDFYGTSYVELDRQLNQGLDIILDIDIQGADNIKKEFKKAILIYIFPPSLDVLEHRLRKRATDDESVIKKRLEKSIKELKNCEWYDYIIINNDLDEAVKRLEAIILSERSRTSRIIEKIKRIFAF
jgi:guanylate kinase